MNHVLGCVGFWLWALVGAGAVLGAISLGPLAFIPLAAAVYLLTRRREWRHGPVLLGLVTGAGLPLLLVAALQWEDWHRRVAGDNTPNPYYWGVVGLALLLTGAVAYAARRPRRG